MNYYKQLTNSITQLGIIALTLTPSTQAGIPSVFKDIPKHIKTPNGISIIASISDTGLGEVSQDSVYFLPTNQTIRLNNVIWNSTVLTKGHRGGLCQHIDDQHLFLKKLNQRRLNFVDLSDVDKQKLQKLKKLKRMAQETSEGQCAESEISIQDISDIKQTLETVRSSLTIANAGMVGKLAQGIPIEDLNKELSNLASQVNELNLDLNRAKASHRDPGRECLKAQKQIQNYNQEINSLEEQSKERQNLSKEITDLLASMNDLFPRLSGGDVSGIWDDGFTPANELFIKENPNATMKRLPQKQLNFYIKPLDNSIGASVFLSFNASGGNRDSDKRMPTKDAPLFSTAENSTDEDQTRRYFSLLAATPFHIDEYSSAGNSGAFDATMSVYGACAILDREENINSDAGIVLTSTSVFPSNARTRASIEYNLWNIMEKIETKGTKGTGFLKLDRETYHEVFQNSHQDGSLKWAFHSEDVIDAAQQEAFKEELKQELMTKFAQAFGEMDTKSPDLSPEPEAGKLEIPIYKPKFLFGIFPIKIFDSITWFGDSKTSAQLKAKLDFRAKEEWDYNRVIPQLSTFSISLKFPNSR